MGKTGWEFLIPRLSPTCGKEIQTFQQSVGIVAANASSLAFTSKHNPTLGNKLIQRRNTTKEADSGC